MPGIVSVALNPYDALLELRKHMLREGLALCRHAQEKATTTRFVGRACTRLHGRHCSTPVVDSSPFLGLSLH